MGNLIQLASNIIFAVLAMVFVIYSIVAIYALNTYGQSKSLTTTASIIYSAAVAGLLTWGLGVILIS
jgi:hypothetical protein